ncbi:MAG: recombinase family protein [Chloroflexi bacterium]|nr:recombinase family protein [Chloroflexota bacterium]
MPIRALVTELHTRGIATATGREWWAPRTIHAILTTPLYGGRYYALRQTSVEPRRRWAQTYGKRSMRLKPLSEALHLSSIVVERPPLTWDEWLELQERLKGNKAQAQRHAKRDYLLRSFLFCDAHHRRYHGRKKGNAWQYACSTRLEHGHRPCPRPKLPRRIEEQVKALCRHLLESPEIIEREIKNRTGTVQSTRDTIEKRLVALDRKRSRSLDTETNLALEKARSNVSPEAYERALARVRAERTWIAEERQRLESQLKMLDQGHAALRGLAQVRQQLAHKLDSANTEDWRMIFNALGMECHVTEQGDVEVGLAIPVEAVTIVSQTPGGHPQPPGRKGFALSELSALKRFPERL